MTPARKLQQTTFKNNGDGNGRGQWQWLWLVVSRATFVHKSVWSKPLMGRQGVADIVLLGMRPPAIYWHRWRAAYLLELVCRCLAPSPPLCQVHWTFSSHHLNLPGLVVIHMFWPVCNVSFMGSPDFVNLSCDSFRIRPKDIFAVWHGLAFSNLHFSKGFLILLICSQCSFKLQIHWFYWLLSLFCCDINFRTETFQQHLSRTAAWKILDFELWNFWEKEDLKENRNLSRWYEFWEMG